MFKPKVPEACFLLSDACAGFNSNRQLGDGTFLDRGTPVSVSGGIAFTQIAAGNSHTCGIQKDTDLAFCWGKLAGLFKRMIEPRGCCSGLLVLHAK